MSSEPGSGPLWIPNEDILYMLEKRTGALMRRRAYICSDGEVKTLHDEGFVTVSQTFIARPATCRYCVLETEKGEVVLVDLWELVSVSPTEVDIKPEAVRKFDTTDAAIMYAVMTFNH